ncbi:hypothetical protein DICPUDRAFT_155738 [Dictyostelium purpureum]|uniref:Carbohydrate kinase PfkB domain-containing protein n=1 Tax=Dictyostelium purpureum TaxID=5786 RepID=F0ZUR7_DICPU|nr:uncharacterized protein DICPUDRAFT_155738 [Dictyostelium purpureum]EGC32322.1 hypothetical protein DICPUDRAFT_155738 [Dictyostelium purpureum]|eukprot:XP_003291164.1 hypothetical protein DICPUDRAFT_155738 [Dictyostelium purpureum]
MKSLIIISIFVILISFFIKIQLDQHQSFIQRYFNSIDINKNFKDLEPKEKTTQTFYYSDEIFYNIKLSDDVRDALKYGKPVVSLESTIISHGMPYPQNYHTAIEVEDIIRSYGVIPATIAILNGTIHIGLTKDEIHYLSTVGKDAVKTSRRDIAMVMSQGKTGSTTVSATILFSNLVGIKIFVTGGLGGVHRGVEASLDVSADLTELGKNGVMVVCAGVKSILDIGKTLEYLETQGVTVVTYGSDEFPAFFTKHSGLKSPNRLDNPPQFAKLLFSNQLLQLKSGIVVAVPNENENSELIDQAIKESIEQSTKEKIMGKEITPYLLQKVNEKTGGKSLESNIMLVKNNAKIGSQICLEYYALLKNEKTGASYPEKNNQVFTYFDQKVNRFLKKYLELDRSPPMKSIQSPPVKKRIADFANPVAEKNQDKYKVVVVGGAVIDMISHPYKLSGFQYQTSNPGSMNVKMGGVGRNIAEVLTRLELNPLFISLLGDDIHSHILLEEFNNLNMSTYGIASKENSKTAIYNAIMDEKGDLAVAIAQMDIFDHITPNYIQHFTDKLDKSEMIVFDGNIPTESMKYLASLSSSKKIKLWFEPTSVFKSSKIVDSQIISHITFISPNRDELFKLSQEILSKHLVSNIDKFTNLNFENKQDLENIKKHSNVLIEAGIKHVVAKLGKQGVLLTFKDSEGKIQYVMFNAPDLKDTEIVDVNGSGDSLVACSIYSLLSGNDLSKSILDFGTKCAKLALLNENPVSPLIKKSIFK